MPLLEITEQNFETAIMRSELPVLLEFGGDRHPASQAGVAELEALSVDLEGKLLVARCDIDAAPRLAQALRVQSAPTFMVFQEGRPVGGHPGPMNRHQLRDLVEPFLPRSAGALKPAEVAQLAQQGQVSVVDTREAQVFGRAHIPGAVNMPAEEIETRLAELHMLPGMPVLVCRSGDKTKELTEKLAGEGIEVSYLEGGVLGWEGAGFEMEQPDD